jgi:predicted enzyme related to lactoylglutathione lyase
MVDNVTATVEAVVANGGEIVQPVGGDAFETTARFRNPGGNVLGVYQQRRRAALCVEILESRCAEDGNG